MELVRSHGITPIYPHVNDNNQYFKILNSKFVPRTEDLVREDEVLRIMWSGPEPEIDRDWRANHFVSILTRKQQIAVSMSTITIHGSVDTRESKAHMITIVIWKWRSLKWIKINKKLKSRMALKTNRFRSHLIGDNFFPMLVSSSMKLSVQ